MKKQTKFLITLAVIIILSNIPPIYGFFRVMFDSKHYRYSNVDGSFTSYEFMGRRFDSMKSMHSGCLSAQPSLKDQNLYRLFSKNPLAFWRWRLYLFDERYKLPYKDWEAIKKIRETKKVKEITGCNIEF